MPGLAFQEQVEALAAATQGLSPVAPKTAEVLDLKRASIVRSTSSMIDNFRRLTTCYILAAHDLPKTFGNIRRDDPSTKISSVIASLESVIVTVSRPTIVDKDGDNIVEMLDYVAAEWAKRSTDEGRYVRRLSKRVREAGAACDVHRLKVLSILKGMLVEAEELERLWGLFEKEMDGRYAFDDVFEATIADHPVITAYLAR